eukprot:scaffold51014_cov29-Phaeocystis_antarctica.AAC.1
MFSPFFKHFPSKIYVPHDLPHLVGKLALRSARKRGGKRGIGLGSRPRLPRRGRHRLPNTTKAHPASVKVILVLFSDRENLLLLTLSGHRVHGKQAQPLCFARDAPRFSHRVQLGLACFACYAGGAVVRKIASSSYE